MLLSSDQENFLIITEENFLKLDPNVLPARQAVGIWKLPSQLCRGCISCCRNLCSVVWVCGLKIRGIASPPSS